MVQRVRVPVGLAFVVVFLIFARPQPLTLGIGAVIAIGGVALRGWASGHIRKFHQLAVTGPYAFTRNPLYLGSFIMGVGFTIASGVWWLAVLFAVLFLGIYYPVMRVEEIDIRNQFGDEFDEYKRNVPLLVPRITPWKKTGDRFDIRLYLQYREYRAAIGVASAIGILAAKAYFLDP
jgi:protein-S-isoprenylcysteine O-methyltransferase Ste14